METETETEKDDETVTIDKKKKNEQAGGLKFAIAMACILIVIFLFVGIISSMKTNNSVLSIMWKKTTDFIKKQRDQTDSNRVFMVILAILYLMLIFAILIIIEAAYDIKNSYELGANMEKQCNNVFMEKERADFHVYSCYMQVNDYAKKLENGKGIGIFSNYKDSVQTRLKIAYENLLSIIIIIILLVTIIIVVAVPSIAVTYRNTSDYTENFIDDKQNWLQIAAMLTTLLTLLILWIRGNYKLGSSSNRILLNPYIDAVYIHSAVAFWEKDKTVDIMVFRHISYIILILITVVISLYLINQFIKEQYKIPNTFIVGVAILFVMLSVIIPLFIKSAQAFEYNIVNTYIKEGKDKLTALIRKCKTKSSWQRVKKELESNMNADMRSKSNGELFEKINIPDGKDKNDHQLYMYLTHIVNKSNIVGIPIPQELKPIINPKYLAGELSINLKEDLIRANQLYSNDTSTLLTKDTLHTVYHYLKEYLKQSILIKIEDDKGGKELELFNNHVLKSDKFKKGNPFPKEIISKLEQMRGDMTIKNTVDEYFSKINWISSIILIFIAYYLYHNIYPNDVDIKIQYVAMFSFAIILILGLSGWWMKEMWL